MQEGEHRQRRREGAEVDAWRWAGWRMGMVSWRGGAGRAVPGSGGRPCEGPGRQGLRGLAGTRTGPSERPDTRWVVPVSWLSPQPGAGRGPPGGSDGAEGMLLAGVLCAAGFLWQTGSSLTTDWTCLLTVFSKKSTSLSFLSSPQEAHGPRSVPGTDVWALRAQPGTPGAHLLRSRIM